MKKSILKNIGFRKKIESSSKYLLLLSALISILIVSLIVFFIINQAIPTFKTVSIWDFLFSTNWDPSSNNPSFGVASFIIASIEVTFLSLAFSLPIAISCSIYLSEFAKGYYAEILRGAIELLAGIPSIIYGLFGISVIVPFVRKFFGGNGYSLLSASIILAIMILPTIINFSEVSIRSVSKNIRMASIAMGATPWQTIYKVVIPSALKGIVSSIILAVGRAIGETTAVVLVGGNAPLLSINPVNMGRTLTMNIITDMSYAEGVHMNSLFATAMILIFFIIALNLSIVFISRKSKQGVDNE